MDTPFLRELHNDLVEYQFESLAELEQVRTLLDVLEGNVQTTDAEDSEHEPEAPAAEPEPEPSSSPEALPVAMCGQCGAGQWDYTPESTCPVCGADKPVFPAHLQPQAQQPVRGRPGGPTLEDVRNMAARTRTVFTKRDLCEWLDCAAKQVEPHIEKLVMDGMLKDESGLKRWMFRYVADRGGTDPTHRPRGEHLLGVPGPRSGRGEAVPYTGKEIGSSGKPGRDRKLAKQGKRVRRHRQGT